MKNIFLLFILPLFIFDLYSQEDTRKQDQLAERKKYYELINRCEQHSKAIIEHLSQSCVYEYFYDLDFDSSGLNKYINKINQKCYLPGAISAYIGNFVEYNNTLQKKVIHCVYEKEMDCGDWYFQFSYVIIENNNFLTNFLMKNANRNDDIIMNVLYHN